MTEQPKKLSRRDALKILGAAAGATVLANLPSKWTKPELAAGVLPAHAQTSVCIALLIQVISPMSLFLLFLLAQTQITISGKVRHWPTSVGIVKLVVLRS